ncbi:MAG: Uncharacterized protein CEO21_154 [Microgenomates group bacterium Gr01-1014_80]|nr:MAG: Uncharacterized protein CEO21_154 [Microgenomates group bacterium Gr01-1014_80]
MIKYAICEIGGKQYKLMPKVPVEVDLIVGDLDAKVLMVVNDKARVGTPYLNEELNIKKLEDLAKSKIRVAKFHAKANYRKVTGSRRKVTRIILEI